MAEAAELCKPWLNTVPSIQLKRRVAQEFIAGEILYGLASQHDVPRNIIRFRVPKFETGLR